MEQDIIVEGFSKSEQMHGLRYTGLIGDGDSSVYSKIIENVPYGRRVKKKECANHAVTCYRKCSHDLVNTQNGMEVQERFDRAEDWKNCCWC